MGRFSSFIQRSFQKSPLTSLVVAGIIFFLAAWAIFFMTSKYNFYGKISTTVSSMSQPTRLSQTEYPLINPLLLCNVEKINNSIDEPLKTKITNFVNQRIAKGEIMNMSVYLQEYGSGKWVGVNENDQYDPASLLKVPLMIAYYQLAEKTPSLLSETTSFTGEDQNIDEYFKSSNNIVAGKPYTIDQLIQSMIINSDNTAMTLLSAYVDKKSLFGVYTDLGLPTPPNDPTVQYVSSKSYAYFFRILYNATYLDKSDSQKALNLLSQGHLPNGLASGVPSNISVADKFGERTVMDENNIVVNRELHDCGIIYRSPSPYLLCVMSRGKDFEQLVQNIHDISSLVYTDLSSR